MADEKQNTSKSKLTFSQAIGQAFHDVWNVGKLGLVGTIAILFLREEQGREMVRNVAELTGLSLDRIGLEGGSIARHVSEWGVETYDHFRRAIIRAIGVIVLIAALSLLAAACVPWGWVRGLVGTAGIALIVYITHDLWVRWIPVIIGIGAAIGAIEAAEKKTALENLSNPFQVVFGGIKQVPASITWVLSVWKWMALINIWYAVGVLYITLVPLHQTPGLIPMALPLIPIFFMIPLAEPWLKRGTQYSWILWAGVFWLIDIAILAIFPGELYLPIRDGGFWYRVGLVVVVAIEALFAMKLSTNTNRWPAATSTSGHGTPVSTNNGRLYKQPRPRNITSVVGVVTLFGLGVLAFVWFVNTYMPWLWTVNTAFHP